MNPHCMEPSIGGLIGKGHSASSENRLCMREGGGAGNNRTCLGTRFVLRSNCFQNSYVKIAQVFGILLLCLVHYVSAYFCRLFLSQYHNPELIWSLVFIVMQLLAVCIVALSVNMAMHQPTVAATPRNVIFW